MIVIKQKSGKWRLEIKQEEWEIDDRETFEQVLKWTIDCKFKYSNLKGGEIC